MSSRTPFIALSRMVLLTLLVLGLCLQPAFAATCAIDDARSTHGGDAGPTVNAVDVDASASGDGCCSNQVCSDCCLHGDGSLHCVSVAVASVIPMRHVSPNVDEFRPIGYPVDIRPPIAR